MAVPPVFVSGAVLTAAQMNAIGLWVVDPKTTFTSATNITRDGVFTDDYDNYLLLISYVTSSISTGTLQLRAAGVAQATGYNRQVLTADSTTISGARSTGQTSTSAIIAQTNGTFYGFTALWIMNPKRAIPTTFFYQRGASSGNYTTPILQHSYETHDPGTGCDGFAITMAGGTNTTGDYVLYGWRK